MLSELPSLESTTLDGGGVALPMTAHRAQLEAIYRLSEAIHRAPTVADIYEQALDAIQSTLNVQRASMVLYDETDKGRLVASRGLSRHYCEHVINRRSITLPGPPHAPEPLIVGDIEADLRAEEVRLLLRREGIRSLVFFPLVSHGKKFGRFGLYYAEPHRFTVEEVQLARTIADLVAFAVERWRYEQKLRRNESFNRAILNSLAANIAVVDRTGEIIAVNDAWIRFGQDNSPRAASGSDSLGQANYLSVCDRTPAGRAAAQGIREVLAKQRASFTLEYACHSPQKKRWFLMQVTPLLDDADASSIGEDTGPEGAVIIHTDITARKEAEAERLTLLEQAQEANRAKDEFLAVVSHELRTPLNSIMGWNALLRSEQLDKTTRRHAITAIENGARSQSALINDLLDVSRIISGKLRVEMQAMELAPIIEAVAEAEAITAAQKSVNLRVRIAPDLPTIIGDPLRVQQVLWNLLANAFKFTPEGGMIEITATHNATHGVLCVRDNGCGIAPDFLPYVFDRFRQASSSSTRRHGGLGLGLSIVRHIVEVQNGRIVAASDGQGKGAAFTVTLPLTRRKWPAAQ